MVICQAIARSDCTTTGAKKMGFSLSELIDVRFEPMGSKCTLEGLLYKDEKNAEIQAGAEAAIAKVKEQIAKYPTSKCSEPFISYRIIKK